MEKKNYQTLGYVSSQCMHSLGICKNIETSRICLLNLFISDKKNVRFRQYQGSLLILKMVFISERNFRENHNFHNQSSNNNRTNTKSFLSETLYRQNMKRRYLQSQTA